MESMGGKRPVPAGGGVAQEVGPQPQVGDHSNPVRMGDHPGGRRARLHGAARHGRGNGWEGGTASCCQAPDHTRGHGRPPLGGREAPTLARPHCPGYLARRADAASHHLVGGRRDGNSRVRILGSGRAWTPLRRRPSCVVPWKVGMVPAKSTNHGINYGWPRTTRRSCATTQSRWLLTWNSVWPPTP